MKIVYRVGEWLLPHWIRTELRPVLTFTGTGRALADGSRILARRGWTMLGEHLDRWERYGAVAAAGYAAGFACWHTPDVARFAIPGAVVAWCVAAWWHATPAAVEPEPIIEVCTPADAFVPWLLELMGDRPGIHLRDLYPAMRKLPGHEGRDNAQLRAALRALDIPVRRSLRLGGVAGRSGVARTDLEALPSPTGEWGGESDGDAGQRDDSSAGEQPVERSESA